MRDLGIEMVLKNPGAGKAGQVEFPCSIVTQPCSVPGAKTYVSTRKEQAVENSVIVRTTKTIADEPPSSLMDVQEYSSRLTPRLSCGARAPQRFRPRPPARRLLQPVVRRRPDSSSLGRKVKPS